MALLRRHQRLLSQPQTLRGMKDPGFWRLVDVQGMPLHGSSAGFVSLGYTGTVQANVGAAGKCIDFVADSDWMSYGTVSGLQLSTMTGIAVIEVPTTTSGVVILNTRLGATFASGFVIRIMSSGLVNVLKQDVVEIGSSTQAVRKGGVSTVAWSYNNVTGLMRFAVDGVFNSVTHAETFTHGEIVRNRYYDYSPTQCGAHKQYLLAISAECDKVADKQLIDWSLNPWSIYKEPSYYYSIPADVSGSSGTISFTEEDDTVAAVGTTTVKGTIAFTEADDTVAASGSTTTQGTIAFTEADDIVSASGTTTVKGSIAFTESDDVVSAFGATGSDVIGSISFTEADDIVSAAGTTTVKGTISFTEADDIVAGSGSVVEPVTGIISFTEEDDLVAISGFVPASGTLLFTEEDDVVLILGVAIPGWSIDEPLTGIWSLETAASGAWTKDTPLL